MTRGTQQSNNGQGKADLDEVSRLSELAHQGVQLTDQEAERLSDAVMSSTERHLPIRIEGSGNNGRS